MTRNPAVLAGQNRQPAPRAVRALGPAELEAIAAELAPAYRRLPLFAAATGLRPEEWTALERRDINRSTWTLTVAHRVQRIDSRGWQDRSEPPAGAAVYARACRP